MPALHTRKKRLSRRLRKKLYRILTTLNEYDFSKLRPLGIFFGIALLLGALCLLPTTRTDNQGSPETLYGEYLADAVRTAVAEDSTSSEDTVDIVALFLPDEAVSSFSSGTASAGMLSETLASDSLYSIYLTGEELYALAESAVAFPSALKDTTVFLSGLSYTYHPFRLPMNRIIKLTLADGTSVAKDDSTLYRVIGGDELFPLFQYLSYRSQGIMRIFPKNRSGVLLSAYEEALLTKEQLPLSLGMAVAYSSNTAERRVTSYAPSKADSASVVTKLGGFNLMTLIQCPNHITLYVSLLFIMFITLLRYCIPRIRRVIIWIRIYAIHRRKRGHVTYRSKKSYYRKAS
ncbi:MAG: 5'-nucleotidase C-terminal domain-containing protein [Lachnospiraceae bacterium]